VYARTAARTMDIGRITVFCFAASYAVALALELLQLFWPRPVQRWVGLGFGLAGLLAHTLFLVAQRLPLSSRQGSLLFLAWIIAVFYAYGTLHHRKVAWGLFVLPLVLGLVGIAVLFAGDPAGAESFWLFQLLSFQGERFWGVVHAALLLLAAVGVCVAFVASAMYLVHARRLQNKTLPREGFRMLSLERLEEMNRRAIVATFPLLTAGVLVGLALMAQAAGQLQGWTDPRVLAAVALWLVFAILLYLRYSLHLRGRRVAILTIVAFVLLLVTFALPHTFSGGGAP
jgi:ABC-type transport system involved in cytochrome c biogenesis permease subunit